MWEAVGDEEDEEENGDKVGEMIGRCRVADSAHHMLNDKRL